MKAGLKRLFRWEHFTSSIVSACLVAGFGLAATRSSAQNTPANVPEPRVETFKRFVANPPSYQMIAEFCRFPDGKPEGTTDCKFILLRYQPDGFYFREGIALQDLTDLTRPVPGGRWAGRAGEYYWDVGLDGMTLATGTNADSRVAQAVELVMAIHASPLMHLGVNGSLPGSLAWDGHQLRRFTNRFGVAIEGDLTVGADTQPHRLNLRVTTEERIVPWEITYDYHKTPALPDYLPSRISIWFRRTDTPRLGYIIRLLEVRILDQPLPVEMFLIGGATNRIPHHLLVTPPGTWSRNPQQSAMTRVVEPSDSSPQRRNLVLTLFVAANVALVSALLIRARLRRAASLPPG